jgi:hypothetical protein
MGATPSSFGFSVAALPGLRPAGELQPVRGAGLGVLLERLLAAQVLGEAGISRLDPQHLALGEAQDTALHPDAHLRVGRLRDHPLELAPVDQVDVVREQGNSHQGEEEKRKETDPHEIFLSSVATPSYTKEKGGPEGPPFALYG